MAEVVQTTQTDAAVQYQRDRDALFFIKSRIDQAIAVVRNRVHVQGRSATPEEGALIGAYKAAVAAIQAAAEATGLKLVNPLGQPVAIVSPELSETTVLGTSEERMTAASAFKEKQKADLKALLELQSSVEAEFHASRAAGGFATTVANALNSLPQE